MALLAGSDGAGDAPPRRRRIARALTWPLRAVWSAFGWLARGLMRLSEMLWAVVSWIRRPPRFVDGPAAVALFAFTVLGTPGRGVGVFGTVIIAAQALPLAVARSRPVPAAVVMACANAIGLIVLRDNYPVVNTFALVAVVAIAARRVDRAAAAQVGTFVAVALLPMLWHPTMQPQPLVLGWWLVAIITALALGDLVRSRRDAEAGRIAAQRQQALLEERSRIARELHDVVAHHMSLIAVQSQSAPRRIAGLPPEGVADFQDINAAARRALTEMRRVLAVLRAGDGAERAPQPGIDALPALIAEAGQSGQHVDLRVEGAVRPLRDAVDVSIYRIVQEALTNVRQHAGVDTAEVTISYRDDAVGVRVADRGGGDRSTGALAGHGLVGMRERVAMLGGRVSTGDRDGGGFVVDALLPYDGAVDAS